MKNQKDLFQLSPDSIYLNGAYMSPQLKSVEQIGISWLKRKNDPFQISGADFFSDRVNLKKRFADLIDVEDFENIAIIPSVSYAIANAANSMSIKKYQKIIVVEDQFPSNVYSWKKLAKQKEGVFVTIHAPKEKENRAETWNQRILTAIDEQTVVIAISHVHWADGTLFDLKQISKKAKKVGAKLVVDGTQSVGALPFSLKEIPVDVLICAGYKWLMGPYSLGVAYYHPDMCKGEPIENNWFSRKNSEDFTGLTNYEANYKKGAERFSVGESSNFICVPMLTKGIEQLLEWGQENIQTYCHNISQKGIEKLREKGCYIEKDENRAKHLFGIYLPKTMNKELIKERLVKNKISVSYRGSAIRVSPHVYNTEEEFLKLVDCIY